MRKVLLVVAAMAVSAVLVVQTASAGSPNPEAQFVDLVNADRAAAGLKPLRVDVALADVARTHSGRMSQAGTIFHNQNLASEVTGPWLLLGENVGVGPNVPDLHRAFMASTYHRENVLGDFTAVGVGIVMNGETIYVTEVFKKAPAPTARKAKRKPRRPARAA